MYEADRYSAVDGRSNRRFFFVASNVCLLISYVFAFLFISCLYTVLYCIYNIMVNKDVCVSLIARFFSFKLLYSAI